MSCYIHGPSCENEIAEYVVSYQLQYDAELGKAFTAEVQLDACSRGMDEAWEKIKEEVKA